MLFVSFLNFAFYLRSPRDIVIRIKYIFAQISRISLIKISFEYIEIVQNQPYFSFIVEKQISYFAFLIAVLSAIV